MANEHVARLQKIGLGKESTSGTEVSVVAWVPKSAGVFTPKFDVKMDESAYGIIDKNKEGQTMRAWTEVDISGEPRATWFGHLLNAAFGTAYDCVKVGISGGSGTFTEGETVTETTSSATAVIRRSDQGAGTSALYLDPASGTLTGGLTLTGGTSGATATGGTIIAPGTGKHHVFRRLNNNTHPSYTIYNNDPLEDFRAAYCMLDSLEFEVVSNDWAKFKAKFMGKAAATVAAQTPSYTSEAGFFGKVASFKFASAFNSLDAASAINVERFKLTISKNVEGFQAFGGTALTSLHNRAFEVKGEITLLYNVVTQRDYLTNSTKQAARLTIANTGATAVSGSTYPTVQFDMPSCVFTEWSRTDANDDLVRQTLSFTAEYDVTRAMTLEALLVNTQTTAY